VNPAAVIALGGLAGLVAALWSKRARAATPALELGGKVSSAVPGFGFGKAPPIRAYAPADFQTTCDPTPKQHAKAFKDWVLANYGGRSGGIARACNIGGKSEHKEGRAWDWFPPNKEAGDRLVADLLAADKWGRPDALARKWGLQYLIWYRRMWRAYSKLPDKWHPYRGASPHTDHIHVTLSREAAS
jgi:hypothetical protein